MIKFSDVVEMSKHCRHEGFVVRETNYPFNLLLKIKSPYYLAKKFLMRGGNKKWDMIWDNPKNAKQIVDEEYYTLLEWLRNNFTKVQWAALDPQERRKEIENFFGG